MFARLFVSSIQSLVVSSIVAVTATATASVAVDALRRTHIVPVTAESHRANRKAIWSKAGIFLSNCNLADQRETSFCVFFRCFWFHIMPTINNKQSRGDYNKQQFKLERDLLILPFRIYYTLSFLVLFIAKANATLSDKHDDVVFAQGTIQCNPATARRGFPPFLCADCDATEWKCFTLIKTHLIWTRSRRVNEWWLGMGDIMFQWNKPSLMRLRRSKGSSSYYRWKEEDEDAEWCFARKTKSLPDVSLSWPCHDPSTLSNENTHP